MSKIVQIIVALSCLAILSSCSSADREAEYFANAAREVTIPVTQSYNHKIQKDDRIAISITSKSPELVIPFTQVSVPSTQTVLAEGQTAALSTQKQSISYLVDSSGYINFPILGKIRSAGLTYSQLSKKIEDMLINGGYITDPSVIVELENFKITILGEVNEPGIYQLDRNRVSIIDAIAEAGDLTNYAVRDAITIVKESNGERKIVEVNLHDKSIFSSPYFYMEPNDILYVKPNGWKEWSVEGGSTIIGYGTGALALILSLVSFSN